MRRNGYSLSSLVAGSAVYVKCHSCKWDGRRARREGGQFGNCPKCEGPLVTRQKRRFLR